LIVHRSVASELVDRLADRAARLVVGDPADPGTDVGPVIDCAARDRILGVIGRSVSDGGVLVCGGEAVTPAACPGGGFVSPTIIRVPREHRLAHEEVFGPVLAVIVIDELDEALEVVNDTEYGLSAAIYTRDINVALGAVEGVDTGIVYVNAPTIGAEIPLPFGGTKHTGNGYREAGTRGIEQFSQVKTVYVDYSGRLQKAQIDNRPPMTGRDSA
jgi:aldehyde dehydrogenase (NAD+)